MHGVLLAGIVAACFGTSSVGHAQNDQKILLDGIANLVDYAIPLMTEAAAKGGFSADLKRLTPGIVETMKSKGSGALLHVPIGELPGSGVATYGGIQVLGYGESPELVFADYVSAPQRGYALPENYSERRTFYVWLDFKAQKVGTFPYPAWQSFQRDGLKIANDKLLRNELKKK